MNKYFPPASPISHQERAKSAECPKNQEVGEKRFLNKFGRMLFRCDILEENVS